MVDIVRRIASFGFKCVGRHTWPALHSIEHYPKFKPRVLVVGVYLSDKENRAQHLVDAFDSSRFCSVTQRWTAIGHPSLIPSVAKLTAASITEKTPKFELINRCIDAHDLSYFDYILVSDDDITVPQDFVDRFIGWQQYCAFDLAQPARTWRSYVDHPFVRRNPFCRARETGFVEIGPIFCVARSMAPLIIPFDLRSPMGWGYDLIWPAIARRNGLHLGIVDDAAIDHSIRARGKFYDAGAELDSMQRLLAANEHVSAKEAFSTLRQYR